MEPRIQYAQTADGVSIAFWTMGEGMPLVQMPVLFSHIQMECQWPEFRSWYERLAENRKLVRYDRRGTGLSERNVTDYPLDAHVLDLEAVVDCLGLERFALLGGFVSGPPAIAYAAGHPERVSHLFLWCTWARGSDYFRAPQVRALISLVDKDWEVYTESAAQFLYGWSAGEEARQTAAYMRECITQEALLATHAAGRDFDVTALLPEVRSPTLVLHRRQAPYPGLDVASALASRIRGARLALLEGSLLFPHLGDTEAVLAAIDEFLGEGEEAAAEAEPPEAGAFRTVLFTDVEGSTALTQRLGDARAREVLREHERIVREALKSHAGSELKTMGDGFMASFASATRALESAIAMQRAFAAHNQSAPEPILVRVGLNAGEPIAEEADLFGTAVIEAARIASAAKGGEILVSDVVRQLAKGKDFLFADRGEVALRGFEEPVRLYEVRWQEEAT
jgi:class 3 adenylate cyclase